MAESDFLTVRMGLSCGLVGVLSSAAADSGCVVGPVAGGVLLPGDCDVDVDAEGAGEDSCGQFGGELEQGSGAGLGEADPELADALTKRVGTDVLAGLAAGEQPG